MTRYAVLYRASPEAVPLLYRCQAKDPAEARAQCEAAFPGCEVVVVR